MNESLEDRWVNFDSALYRKSAWVSNIVKDRIRRILRAYNSASTTEASEVTLIQECDRENEEAMLQSENSSTSWKSEDWDCSRR